MTDTRQTGVSVNAMNDQGRWAVETHPNANSIHVKEGHLLVVRSDAVGMSTIAIYAPEKWRSAKVVE